ncbi:uncharacterized protein LOC130750511 [Actinidia eriantha]|uniref:uncharacterized protein LOC130750511 n=1 Tax=Actinidia eriantha TaxID=165200 RepID=UPI00258FC965|nr:uncharacterized protein LOC130750511 [Actinidia eriantha]
MPIHLTTQIDKDILRDGMLVDEAQATDLIREVSDEDIKEALFSIGDDKAPGPDGFSSYFYKKAWNVIISSLDKFNRPCPSSLCTKSAHGGKYFLGSGALTTIWVELNLSKVYLEDKAYDTINWEFVKDVLKGLGFPRVFVGWMIQCISTTSYSISINGALYGFFKGRQGIRQGDPISPFLFVLCLEYLSRSLKQLKDSRDFNFHPKCQGLNLTHLAFADDLILFSMGDVPSVQLLVDKLGSFGECSGLKISLPKLNIFAAGIAREDLDIMKSNTGFSVGRFPFRYLGLPIAATKLTIAQFNPFVDRIAGYIRAWTVGVTNKIIQLCRNFLWGGQAFVSKKPLVAWDDIFLPKMEGGLGFKNLVAWNFALLSKNLWNIHAKKDTLWVRWIHQNYLQNSYIWDYIGSKQDSKLIKHLLVIRDMMLSKEGSVHIAINRMELWARDGKFSTKAAYEYFRPRKINLIWPKLVWKSCIIPKHSFILWLGLKGRLLTRDKMQGIIEDQNCPLCNAADESIDHLFFQCNVGKQVWLQIKYWLGITRAMNTLKAAVKWIIKEARGTGVQAKAKQIGFACTVYYLWEARNERIFEGRCIFSLKTLDFRSQYHVWPVKCQRELFRQVFNGI